MLVSETHVKLRVVLTSHFSIDFNENAIGLYWFLYHIFVKMYCFKCTEFSSRQIVWYLYNFVLFWLCINLLQVQEDFSWISQWLDSKLWYLQCWYTGDINVLLQAIDFMWNFPTEWISWCHKTSSISHTKSQSLNVSCILLQLSSPNSLKPGVKLRMKM